MKKLSIVDLSDRQIRNRLNSWLAYATDDQRIRGAEWYKEAQYFCANLARDYSVPPYIAACIVSILSPSVTWERNKIDAKNLLHAYRYGPDVNAVVVSTYGANKSKAIKLLTAGNILAPVSYKTYAFAQNIAHLGRDHVTIDRWHMRACTVSASARRRDVVEAPTAKQYKRIESITADIARFHNVPAYIIQATIWLTIREKWAKQ